ncbi:MAG TPA: hypothetical protein VKI44_00315 [Acetobacteraceae bacterium]|nr:hypothetical protein [Acetobacteraceae bacterium]
MRLVLVALLLVVVSRGAAAQPADCPTEPSAGPMLPLALDLAGRTGVPSGTTGQAYVAVPLTPPGIACRDAPPPPRDVLRGEPGDLLRGPGTPHVKVEVQ